MNNNDITKRMKDAILFTLESVKADMADKVHTSEEDKQYAEAISILVEAHL